MFLWKELRPQLVRCKKLLWNRPLGLKSFGRASVAVRPWRFEGGQYIEVGSRSLINGGAIMRAITDQMVRQGAPSISIGDDVYIGWHVFISSIGEVSLGDGCVLSDHVYITDVFHGFDPEKGLIMEQELQSKGPVKIGANCFLGYRVAIMPNVTLGEWCIVGANSVVTRSFPAYSMIAGAPARVVKVYSHQSHSWISPIPDQAETSCHLSTAKVLTLEQRPE